MEMEIPEMIGFISFSLVASIVSYILLMRNKDSFIWSLVLWSASSFAWFVYNKANGSHALWFTDFDLIGTYLGFTGVVALGLFYALQTTLLFELSSEYCYRESSKAYITIPICAVIMGIMLIFVNQGYLTNIWIGAPTLIILAGIIYAMWGELDDMDNLFSWIGLIILLLAVASYVYTFPIIIETSAWLFAIIFFFRFFLKGDAIDLLMDIGPKVKSKSEDSVISTNQHLKKQMVTSMNCDDTPMMVVTFKGKYYLNGMKQINRRVRCSIAESRDYTTYMYDREKQKAWILAKYPGADLDKGWSLNVNITKE